MSAALTRFIGQRPERSIYRMTSERQSDDALKLAKPNRLGLYMTEHDIRMRRGRAAPS
jgi:hypothetical protein